MGELSCMPHHVRLAASATYMYLIIVPVMRQALLSDWASDSVPVLDPADFVRDTALMKSQVWLLPDLVMQTSCRASAYPQQRQALHGAGDCVP